MKKIIVLALISIVLVSGCVQERIDNELVEYCKTTYEQSLETGEANCPPELCKHECIDGDETTGCIVGCVPK
ncbi:MAG: hypothetical protein GOV02_03370 [Candidatus Aenigmarchaeota archaeon]|nr:hypothetical protein [Candidatus Aenigmarchaeota archaeon]